jgi:hypothetical protein
MTELELQAQVADYIRLQYPDVIFHSDFGSGIKLTMGQAIKQKRLNGGRRAWPDMFIASPVYGQMKAWKPFDEYLGYYEMKYAGLFIELKREGTRIFKKDGALVADEHIREQFDMLHDLRCKGYADEFGIGFDATKKLIDDYMKGRYAHAD